MIIQGIDVNALPDQFNNYKQGRTLILDGDGPCYVAACTVKRLDTAISRFQQLVLKDMFMTSAQDCRIHLTSKDSDKHGRFRINAIKPYQGNRTGKDKPALLEPLREAMADSRNWLPSWEVILHRELEADDGMIQDAYRLKEHGVIKSEDKDLRMTPYLYFEQKRGQVMPSQEVGWVSVTHTNAGTAKLTGQGPLFFWGQMLMGDTADHIQGVLRYNGQKCGAVGAYNVLKDCIVIDQAANLVLDAYREINQNPIPEAWLLWLIRWEGDNVLKYFDSLALSEANREFINKCMYLPWCNPREEKDARDFN